MSKQIGSFTFVLHFHLPYVLSHGKWPHGMDWLNEAAAETYIPLLNVLNQLIQEGASPKLTIGITPVLSEQLSDPVFKEEFKSYLQQKIDMALENHNGFVKTNQPHMADLAKMWQEFYTNILIDFKEKYNEDVVGNYAKLQEEGYIEIITSGATHGYFPILSQDTSIQAQIKQAIQSYVRHYGRKPKGIWLPECAYRPRYKWNSPLENAEENGGYLRKGVEEFLSENELDYFIIDSHLLKGGKAIGVYLDRFEALKRLWEQFAESYVVQDEDVEKSPYNLYYVSSTSEDKKPVAIFTRDPATGIQVWSGEHGYPGNGDYLDFHKKYFPGGHKYWRVTSAKSDLADKDVYHPDWAANRIPEQAGHFKEVIKEVLSKHLKDSGTPGILTAPFDAELFGHWWFEGPRWIYHVLKLVSQDPEINLVTCSEYLSENPPQTVVSLPEGSWGEGGFHWIWLNDWTKWTWKHIYEAEKEMQELSREFSGRKDDEKLQSILKQTARELLLLQSSDWQFLISTWSARDYAEMRLTEHFKDFERLADMVKKYGRGELVDPGEWAFLGICEERDSLFPEIKPEWWAQVEFPIE